MMNSSSESVNAKSAPGEDRREDQRQDDAAQALKRVRAEVGRGTLERVVEALQPRRDEQDHERRRVDRLADHGRLGRELPVEACS